jgi:hypothetical protein
MNDGTLTICLPTLQSGSKEQKFINQFFAISGELHSQITTQKLFQMLEKSKSRTTRHVVQFLTNHQFKCQE